MSATQVQLRRGTATQVAAFTGAQGEPIVDLTNMRLVLQDGSTPGGFAQASQAWVLAQIAALTAGNANNYTMWLTCT